MRNRKQLIQDLGITKQVIKKQAQEKKKMLERGNPYEINKWVEDSYGISAFEMIDAIIKTDDILQIYEFFYLIVEIRNKYENYHSLKDLGISEEKLEKLQETILKSGNAKLIRYCIGFVPGIDLDKYLQALYETNSFWDINELSEGDEYKNAEEIANPELINEVKLDEYQTAKARANEYSKSGKYFPNSLKDYIEQKDNINLLMNSVIETGSPYLICELANYIEHLPSSISRDEDKKTKLGELSEVELAKGDAMGIYEFLSSVKNISLEMFEKMVKKIIEIGDEKYMRYTQEFTPYKDRIKSQLIEKELQKIRYKKFIKAKNNRGDVR